MTNNRAHAAIAPSDDPVIISIRQSDTNPFVTRTEVERLIAPSLPQAGKPFLISSINTLDLQNTLNAVDNIEWARCSRTSTDQLLIEIIPMKPVARVFDGDSSYYINRQGKRLTASLQYRSDVPVIQGHIADPRDAIRLLPLIDTIAARPSLRQLITAISLRGDDAILIPAIRGHVIDFGAPDTEISNKFDRLYVMYKKVLPVKGWDFYDTISVKFGHQIVATRRFPRQKAPTFIADPEGDAVESAALDNMITADSDPADPEATQATQAEEPTVVIQQ
ncbi:MAG: hypothetical protein HDS75_06515 [Bacteroidales bacterium]|nr:hypothetical protein [Bacteroidales bacterium]